MKLKKEIGLRMTQICIRHKIIIIIIIIIINSNNNSNNNNSNNNNSNNNNNKIISKTNRITISTKIKILKCRN